MSRLVVNISGSACDRARDLCGCDSWIEHWRRHTGSQRLTCSAIGCGNLAEVGAHIRWYYGFNEYIIGLCRSCNHPSNEEPFRVDERTRWAPTGYAVGCGVLDSLRPGDIVRLHPAADETYELVRRHRRDSDDVVEWTVKDDGGMRVKLFLDGQDVRRVRRAS